MRRLSWISVLVVTCCVATKLAVADDAAPVEADIRTAITKALPLLETGSKGSADQRQCFTCHSQAIPVMALAEVRKRGFTINEENFARQLKHTAEHLERGKSSYENGKGQGGKVLTAGYALWTLEAGEHAADATTTAVAQFLLTYQADASHWSHPGSRPPSSGSDFTASYVALRGLKYFGTAEQQPQIESRRKQVQDWVLTATPKDTEDHVFRLWTLPYLEESSQMITSSTAELMALQREDGGWSQTDEMESDAYATATVLAALMRPGQLPEDDTAICRGVQFLLSHQLEDGSWHVVTRAKAFQPYFESGFPHEKDQFISITATGWATLALTLVLPEAASSAPSNSN